MTRPLSPVMFAVALGLAAGSALASHEDPTAHSKHPMKVVVLDNAVVNPSTLTLEHDEVLAFENHSVHPMQVTFTEPADLADKIHCGLVRPTAKAKAEVPWQLFTWQDKKLVATIPPGRFASICSSPIARLACQSGRRSATAAAEEPSAEG